VKSLEEYKRKKPKTVPALGKIKKSSTKEVEGKIKKCMKKTEKKKKTEKQVVMTPKFEIFDFMPQPRATTPPPPPPPPPTPPTTPFATLIPSLGHVEDGAITIFRDKNPVTFVPCFVIKQSFAGCLDQQIYLNDKSMPQFFNFIVNLLI